MIKHNPYIPRTNDNPSMCNVYVICLNTLKQYLNDHFGYLSWRYLPCIKPRFQAYIRGKISPQNMAGNMVLTYLHILGSRYIPIEYPTLPLQLKVRHVSQRRWRTRCSWRMWSTWLQHAPMRFHHGFRVSKQCHKSC